MRLRDERSGHRGKLAKLLRSWKVQLILLLLLITVTFTSILIFYVSWFGDVTHPAFVLFRSKKDIRFEPIWEIAGEWREQSNASGFILQVKKGDMIFRENIQGSNATADSYKVRWLSPGTFIGQWTTTTKGGGHYGPTLIAKPRGIFEYKNGVILEKLTGQEDIKYERVGAISSYKDVGGPWKLNKAVQQPRLADQIGVWASAALKQAQSFLDEIDIPMKEIESDSTLNKTSPKAESVKAAFLRAWKAYWTNCKGYDEIEPLLRNCTNWLDMAVTAVDSISTMALMGLKQPLQDVKVYISSSEFEAKLKGDHMVSTFETTIRILGGLLSAYDLTNEDIYLSRAKLLGDGLLEAFQNNGIPFGLINLGTGRSSTISWSKGNVLLADIMSLQLEFFKLSEYTEDPKYFDAAQKPVDILQKIEQPLPGHFPTFISSAGNKARGFVS